MPRSCNNWGYHNYYFQWLLQNISFLKQFLPFCHLFFSSLNWLKKNLGYVYHLKITLLAYFSFFNSPAIPLWMCWNRLLLNSVWWDQIMLPFFLRMVEFAGSVFQYSQTDWNWVNLIIMMGKTLCPFYLVNI